MLSKLLIACLALGALAEDEGQKVDTVIGIDLGTTYSCVGVYKNGRVEVIANDQGNRVTPSYVAFADAERLIGDAAKNQASLNPENTVYDAKRLIGRRFTDATVQHDMKLWPFAVINKDGKPYVQALVSGEKKTFAPEEISAMILVKMKEVAETFLGKTVKNAVVTAPRVLQRRPAPGDQGRRHHLGPQRDAHHQRADGGGDRVRPRQEVGREEHPRLRPRRRHLRRVAPHH